MGSAADSSERGEAHLHNAPLDREEEVGLGGSVSPAAQWEDELALLLLAHHLALLRR